MFYHHSISIHIYCFTNIFSLVSGAGFKPLISGLWVERSTIVQSVLKIITFMVCHNFWTLNIIIVFLTWWFPVKAMLQNPKFWLLYMHWDAK
jgi:hypothetical protein